MTISSGYDVTVIGSGLIGLSITAHLLQTGYRVVVIDGNNNGLASEAAAGMLTPECEWDPWMPIEFLQLLRSGKAYYPEFLSTIMPRDVSTTAALGFHVKDFLILDMIENETGLDERFRGLADIGARVTWLDRAETSLREPSIDPTTIRASILVSEEAIVNPKRLRAMLQDYVLRNGASIVSSQLIRVDDRGSDFVLHLEEGSTLLAPRAVLATGAWTAKVAKAFNLQLPIVPVKGQMVQLAGPPGMLKHVVYMPTAGCGSLLERAPGMYIAGTSEEYASPTVENTVPVVGSILSRISKIFLQAAQLSISGMWSGFRPMASDELPIIGLSADHRLVVASGHHRNGILLAPLTGKLVGQLLSDIQLDADLALYSPHRLFRGQHRHVSRY